jgi:formate-dependent nitrite reductase membrane component NrfD
MSAVILQLVVGAATVFALLWLVVYERRRSSAPSPAERVLARGWLMFRRTVCFAVATFFVLVAIGVAVAAGDSSRSRLGPMLFSLFIAGMAVWVGLYGGGRAPSMSDDREVHEQRKKRYGWRW